MCKNTFGIDLLLTVQVACSVGLAAIFGLKVKIQTWNCPMVHSECLLNTLIKQSLCFDSWYPRKKLKH